MHSYTATNLRPLHVSSTVVLLCGDRFIVEYNWLLNEVFRPLIKHHLEYLSLKENAQACHIVGNHMSRLKLFGDKHCHHKEG